jgi:hypothetical protein
MASESHDATVSFPRRIRIVEPAVRLVLASVKSYFGSHGVAADHLSGGSIEVIGVHEAVARVRVVAESKQYRDNAAPVALKVLEAAGALTWPTTGSET